MNDFDESKGKWRTIRGRRIFIRSGESLGSAMSRSGKFKREDIREAKTSLRAEDYMNKIKNKSVASKKYQKETDKYYKKTAKKGEYTKFGYEPNTNNQAEKNRINENAPIDKNAKTRVERNYQKYSDRDRRELRHEELQKKLADYRNYKQAEQTIKDEKKLSNKIQREYDNASKYTNKDLLTKRQLESNNRREQAEKTIADYKAKKQSNVKIKEGNPIEDLANDRIKEKQNTLANDKAMLEAMKRKDIKEVNGWTEKDFENRIKKNEDYLKQSNNKIDDNYYKGTKRWGFGYANDDNIPVYDNKIDYSGDFTHANLSKVSNDDLKQIINKQTELYNEAVNRRVGDRRTYNGKKDQLFKDVETLRYSNGMKVAKEEAIKRENDKYPQYKGTPYEVKYYSVEDVFKDPNSKIRQFIDKKRSNRKNKDK